MGGWKGGDPDVDQFLFYLPSGHEIAPAFAPISDGGNIHGVEIRIPVIAAAGFFYQRAPVFEIERIAKIRLPDLLALAIDAFCTRLLIPDGQRMFLVIRHQTDGELLAVLGGVGERAIQNFPPDFALFGLDGFPEPAAVGNGALRKVDRILWRDRSFDRPFFGPFHALVQSVAVVALERLDAHAGIDEDVVDQPGMYDCGLRRDQTRER